MINFNYADLIGKPFELGGRGPNSFDCFGLVREMYKRQGIIVRDYISPKQKAEIIALMISGITEWKKSEEKPGVMAMIRLFGNTHVSFLLPYGKMIHVWEKSGGVCVEDTTIWKKKIIGYYEP